MSDTPRTLAGRALLSAHELDGLDREGNVVTRTQNPSMRKAILEVEREAFALDVEFITAVQRLTEEIYVPHHTPSSESGPEEWDVELLAPASETVEAVIRFLARLSEPSKARPGFDLDGIRHEVLDALTESQYATNPEHDECFVAARLVFDDLAARLSEPSKEGR